MRPKVLLADDHAIIAEGLARLIGDVADLVGQVNDGRRLVEEVRRLRPDIVVTDITMPGMSGIDAMRQLKAEGSEARFIFLTIHTEARLAAEAMRSGASGYLLKQAAGNELFDAIHAAMSGRTYLTPLITGDVLRKLTSPSDAAERELTPRQRDVLRLLAEGKRMKEIAAELDISVRTVENHKAHLLQVLSLGSTAELVRFAIKQHIVPE
jgi:two-component system, NarL family, response regulator NreC